MLHIWQIWPVGFLSRFRPVACWLKSNNNRSTWHLLAAFTLLLYSASPSVTVGLPRSAGRTTGTLENPPKSLNTPSLGAHWHIYSPLFFQLVSPSWPMSPASSARKQSGLLSTMASLAPLKKNNNKKAHRIWSFPPHRSVCLTHASLNTDATYPSSHLSQNLKFMSGSKGSYLLS